MKRFHLRNIKRIAIIFSLVILVFPNADLFCQDETLQIQALKSFRITPKRKAIFGLAGAVYNPNLDHYIVLFVENQYDAPGGPIQKIYSRMFNRAGKKAGPLRTLRDSHDESEVILFMDMTLNEIENEILVVWSALGFDEIKCIPLSGDGRLIDPGYGEDPSKTVKAPSHTGSGFLPRVTWIPNRNLYAVGWANFKPHESSSLDNGFYLSVLKPSLKRKLKPTKVKQMTFKNDYYYVTTLLPVGDRLFWGAAQDAKKKIKPVVWFTDLKGEAVVGPHTKNDGSILPEKKLKGEGKVMADYNPYHDQYLLIWNKADKPYYTEQTFRDTYYRIMNSDGSFIFKKRKMPKNFRFHTAVPPLYNPIYNNFLVVYSEHKILYDRDIPTEFQGGRLWATLIDAYGNLGIPNSGGQTAIPLTDVFTDKQTATRLAKVIYNPLQNEYLVLFEIIDLEGTYDVHSDIWGIILK